MPIALADNTRLHQMEVVLAGNESPTLFVIAKLAHEPEPTSTEFLALAQHFRNVAEDFAIRQGLAEKRAISEKVFSSITKARIELVRKCRRP